MTGCVICNSYLLLLQETYRARYQLELSHFKTSSEVSEKKSFTPWSSSLVSLRIYHPGLSPCTSLIAAGPYTISITRMLGDQLGHCLPGTFQV